MTRIKYFSIIFELASPLAIGSGENANTDSDIILDSSGKPTIPATAIAGVFRNYLNVGEYSELFGYIPKAGTNAPKDKAHESNIRFYDARLISDSFFTTVRDSVKLENKVGVNGAKFDIEAVETGIGFEAVIELKDDGSNAEADILRTLGAINAGFLRIGSKTSRGYGRLKVV